MRIIILDGYTLNPGDLSWKVFDSLAEVIVYDRTPDDLIIQRIGDSKIILTNKTFISREVIRACPNLEYIGVLATGYNSVDLKAARDFNIDVTNVPKYGTSAVAQFTIALLLELCHRVGDHSVSVHNGDWQKNLDFCYWKYPLTELAGKKMGIIGFGSIGQAVAKIASAFGMKILIYSRQKKIYFSGKKFKQVGLVELFSKSDVISLHCPLTPDTSNLIDSQAISLMKKTAYLINTSRGALINEKALADALNSDRIAGAALDVVSEEPILPDNPLLQAKNCIITPHIAWAPKEARAKLMKIAFDNLSAWLSGKPINIVSK